MNLKEIKKKLHNHSEDIVLENMEDLIENNYQDICTCKQCLLDIASLTLNKIPAKYISSHKGNIHTKIAEFEQQYQVDLVTHLTKAIKIVKNNPSPNCKSQK
ncbi:MAG: late competence development ComFB family protein [bacterium]